MGMDVYGLNPRVRSEDPGDRSAATGAYFRANVWSWRPIHLLCDKVIELYNLPLSTEGWENNGGQGLRTQQECDRLADALEAYLEDFPPEGDQVAVDLGVYCDETGKLFVGEEHRGKKGLRPAHYTDLEHLREWLLFLRNCGGFEIW